MRDKRVRSRKAASVAGGLLVALAAVPRTAAAFPFIDASNADSLPSGAPLGQDLPSTDVSGLRNQLRLTGANVPKSISGWSILPRLTVQEEFTDNALVAQSPRRADAITIVAPGVTVLADTYRLQLNVDYEPTLSIYANDGPLNALTQHLNALGSVTVVPDLAYVDVRAVSGVQSLLGSLAGTSNVGTSSLDSSNASALITGGSPGAGSLNRRNEIQTTSFGISPYLLHKFNDTGTAKLGVSLDVSSYSPVSGFVSSPIPTSTSNGQQLLTTEEFAQFTSGERFGKFQDILTADVTQGTSHLAGTNTVPGGDTTSVRETINNQVSYALNRSVTILASIGQQHVGYSGSGQGGLPRVDGLTWDVGVTLTPGPDSFITVRYGHLNGTNHISGDARLAFGGHSLVTIDYSNTIGTQLESLQSQLNAAGSATQGQLNLISALTGGPALTVQNAQPVADGVFRTSTLTMSYQSVWPRDTYQATLLWSVQTNLSPT